MTQKLKFVTSSHSLLALKLLLTSPAADTPFMIPLEGKLFVPEKKEKSKMGVCQHQTDNYCCGYKNNHWNLNLMVYFSNSFYIYIIIFISWDKQNKPEKQLKLGF